MADVPHWQQFTNHGNVLKKVELHIGQYMTYSKDITLSIEETVGGTILTSITYPATALPLNMQGWFVFDVPDVSLVNAKTYYIFIRFASDSEYAWSEAHGDPYTPGGSSHPYSDWDYAFKTHVDKSRPRTLNLFHNFLQLGL